MDNLKKYKFSSLYEMSSGISTKPEQAGHGAPFVSFGDVFNNYFLPDDLENKMDTSHEEQEKYSVKEGDIFLTRTSETLDELGMSCVVVEDYPNATYSGFVKRLRPTQDDITYAKFMAFYLRGKLFRKTMNNNAIMTLRASLNENIFSYFDLLLPPFDTQKKIGDFLFDIYKKIEINNRINQELEAMAKTIYDYWFVQFDFPNENGKPYQSRGEMEWNEELKREIPKGWKVESLGNVLKTSLGGTPSTKVEEYWNQGKYPWLNSGEIANFPIIKSELLITKEAIENSATKLLPIGTVVLSITRHLRPSILAIDACANQSVIGIYESEKIKSSYIFPYLKNEIPRLMKLRTGAQQPHINKKTVDTSFILIPPKDILVRYYKTVDSIYKKINNTAFQNQELKKLREWLLPMLMNGQVKVK